MTIDLGPAASRMADLIGGVPDEMPADTVHRHQPW